MIGVARVTCVLSATLIASGMFGGTALAEQNTGSLYGRIYSQGTHHPAACVTVRVFSDKEPMQETRTRADGSFTFVSVFPGDVTIVVGKQAVASSIHASLETDENVYVPQAIADDNR